MFKKDKNTAEAPADKTPADKAPANKATESWKSQKVQLIVELTLNVIAILAFAGPAIFICTVAVSRDDNDYLLDLGLTLGLAKHMEQMWHVILCSIGCLLLIPSVLLSWNKWFHIVLAAIGTLLVIVGVAMEMYLSIKIGSALFNTQHGRMGLTAVFMIVVVIVFGLLVTFGSSCVTPVYFEELHHLLGFAVVFTLLLTSWFGITGNGWFFYITSCTERYVLIGFITVSFSLVVIMGIMTCVRKYAKP